MSARRPPARCDVPDMLNLLEHLESPTLHRSALPDVVHWLAVAVRDAATELEWHRAAEHAVTVLLPDLEQTVGELALQVRRLQDENRTLQRGAEELRDRIVRLIERQAV